jgi:Cu/Ag efflux pump CusA
MEILGQGLMALGSAIGSVATAFGFIGVAGIAAGTFLVYMDKMTVEQLKDLLKQVLQKRGGGWPH